MALDEKQRYDLIHRLVKACWDDDREVVKECLAIDATIIDEYAPNCDATVLEATTWHGSDELAHWLLDQGASPSPKGHELRPINGAAICGRISILQRLIDMGADVGITLAYASRRGQYETIRTLLAAGADPNRKAPVGEVDGMAWRGVVHQGETALHMAARHGDVEAARLLIEGGADIRAKDVHGETPLTWFSRYRVSHPNLGWTGEKLQSMAVLLVPQGNADETLPANYEIPKLCEASISGDVNLVQQLLKDGTAPNTQVSATSETPLHLSATFNRPAITKLLLAAGANPNAKAKVGVLTRSFWRDVPVVGETPLHRAAGYSCREIVVALKEAGADENILDANGQSGITWFSRNSNWDWHDDITSRDEVGKMIAPDDYKDRV